MDALIVISVGFIVGFINAVAGGASAISFPVLLAVGLNPVSAAITNSIGVSASNFFALLPQRSVLKKFLNEYRWLMFWSAFGAILGAIALLAFPEEAFSKVVPFLLLFATLSILIPLRPSDARRTHKKEAAMIFGSGIYCGYFGPGQGTMVIATLIRKRDAHTVNIAKNLIVGITGVFTSVIFIFSGQVNWWFAFLLFLSSNTGAFIAGKMSKKFPVGFLKGLVVAVGLIASAWLFNKYLLFWF